ncbi:protein of unknown function [Candidatus Methylocalor cossyra]|uniref:Uncharacterized protein n=1 Tax=Candidatus Methylocalor cossyra TaxID=3108543 RepID=A0ABM9NJV4_9GAMM
MKPPMAGTTRRHRRLRRMRRPGLAGHPWIRESRPRVHGPSTGRPLPMGGGRRATLPLALGQEKGTWTPMGPSGIRGVGTLKLSSSLGPDGARKHSFDPDPRSDRQYTAGGGHPARYRALPALPQAGKPEPRRLHQGSHRPVHDRGGRT